MMKKQYTVRLRADRAAARTIFYATLAPVEAAYATALANANAIYSEALAVAKKAYKDGTGW